MKASKQPKVLHVGTFWPYFYDSKLERPVNTVVGIVKEDGLLHVADVKDVYAAIEKAKRK